MISTNSELSHSMAHYLLAIHKLKESKGYARVTDIAKELNLTKGSVSTAINGLKKKDLVEEEEDSKFLLLTSIGHQEVHNILSNRILIYHFLKDLIGVTDEAARKDSCLMEHLISEETREKFFDFMKDISCDCKDSNKQAVIERIQHFQTKLDLCDYKNSEQFVDEQSCDYDFGQEGTK